MLEIDQRFDHLKLIKQAGYRQPDSNPDLEPAHEALLLNELFKELLRSPVTEKRNADFLAKLRKAEAASDGFYQTLGSAPVVVKTADASYQRINNACNDCHKMYRNRH